jgi:hypothetical protein
MMRRVLRRMQARQSWDIHCKMSLVRRRSSVPRYKQALLDAAQTRLRYNSLSARRHSWVLQRTQV